MSTPKTVAEALANRDTQIDTVTEPAAIEFNEYWFVIQSLVKIGLSEELALGVLDIAIAEAHIRMIEDLQRMDPRQIGPALKSYFKLYSNDIQEYRANLKGVVA
jgi:hypothetical protein